MATKEEKREVILDTAARIFMEEGLFNTSMDHIAIEAGFTRRTLYRYFDKKDDLAIAVTTRLLKSWNEFQRVIFNNIDGNGLERLGYFLTEAINYMSDKNTLMNYLGEFDFYFKDISALQIAEASFDKYQEETIKSSEIIQTLLQSGIDDGSIKSDVDLALTEATISNILWGFGQRIAARGKVIEAETGYDPLVIIKHQLKLYIDALKS